MEKSRGRVSVHEMIYGNELAKVWAEMEGDDVDFHYPDLSSLISKAVAYGFVDHKEYERWVHDE